MSKVSYAKINAIKHPGIFVHKDQRIPTIRAVLTKTEISQILTRLGILSATSAYPATGISNPSVRYKYLIRKLLIFIMTTIIKAAIPVATSIYRFVTGNIVFESPNQIPSPTSKTGNTFFMRFTAPLVQWLLPLPAALYPALLLQSLCPQWHCPSLWLLGPI